MLVNPYSSDQQRSRFIWLMGIQAVLVVVLLIASTLLTVGMNRLRDRDETLLSYRVRLNDVNIALLSLHNNLRGYTSTGSEIFFTEMQKEQTVVAEGLQFLLVNPPDPSLPQVAEQIDHWLLNTYQPVLDAVANQEMLLAELTLEQGRPQIEAVVNTTTNLRTELRQRSEAYRNQIDTYNWIKLASIGLLCALIVVSMIVTVRFWRTQQHLIHEIEDKGSQLLQSNHELNFNTNQLSIINSILGVRINESRVLREISDYLVNNPTPNEAYSFVAQTVGNVLNTWCSIALRLPPPREEFLDVVASYHSLPSRQAYIDQMVQTVQFRIDNGLYSPVFTERAPLVELFNVPVEQRHPNYLTNEVREHLEPFTLYSYIAVPIKIQDEAVGLISAASDSPERLFDHDQTLFVRQVADRLAAWLENIQLFYLLKQQANELQTSFDSLDDIVVAYDSRGHQTRINEAGTQFFAGRHFDFLSTNLVWRTAKGNVLGFDEHPIQQALAGTTVRDVEVSLARSDGVPIIHEVSVSPLRSADGSIEGIVLVARDLSARKELDRLKEELVANMSHELRTPLTAILGYSELLLKRRTEVLTPWHTTKIEGIRTGGQRLLSLVNDLLDIAKLDAGRIELQRQTTMINSLLQEQVAILQPMIREKHQTLTLQLGEHLPLLMIDPERIGQAVTNLLSNAIKFTPEQGTITLTSTALIIDEHGQVAWLDQVLATEVPPMLAGQYVLIQVSDSGVGVPAEALVKLWDRFYQVEGGSTRRFGGTGLGLSIVQQLVELHGGRTWATSAGENQGSSFTIMLPVSRGTQFVSLNHGLRRSILVIENDQQTAQNLEEQLQAAGFEVIVAADRHSALAWANKHSPAAITLDLLMPNSESWETLAALREIDHLAQVPVLIASDASVYNELPGVGVSTYVVKPIDSQILIRIIRQLIGAQSQAGFILVVDDDYDMAELLCATLQEHGYVTQASYDGAAALDLIQKGNYPQLILLDLMMPVVDGFQLLEKLRANPETRNIPVIIVTARDLTNEEIRQLRQAAQAIQTKHTLSMRKLVAEVQRFAPLKESDTP
ncbi:response regulator [Herpetosiphon gulosus]|uniref:histidine kinase n=1 Tax=Herpetosiphon gulosus TaxID=1973496 RepID=A0ABP9WUX6_9CHLR